MNHYISGDTIRSLREKRGYTQRQLAEKLLVSDKAVSKWETGKGLPDITLIEPLAAALGVSIVELLSGEHIQNQNMAGKMLKSRFYVCPVCGNVIHAMGEGVYSCCGIVLPPLSAEEADGEHRMETGSFEAERVISFNHEMTKEHYISFIAYATLDQFYIKKLYPEQSPEASFPVRGHGFIYVYCNRHGLYKFKV